MKTKHTPGPWHTGMRPGPIIYGPKGEQVADLLADSLPPGENQANARLIATAPDLLAALNNVVSCYRTFRNVPKEEQEWTVTDDDALEAAFSAIAKANGE